MNRELSTVNSPSRIVILGTTGSGKTTIARRLAAAIGGEHIELDALYWGPNWQPVEVAVFRERIAAAIEAPRWVIDGNYTSMTRDVHWAAADTIVWLDYPFLLVMWRLLRRVIRRSLSGEELWGGNRESLRTHFLSSDSLFNWARKTHWKHRKAWPDYFRQPELAHVRFVRLRSPGESERLLREIAASAQV